MIWVIYCLVLNNHYGNDSGDYLFLFDITWTTVKHGIKNSLKESLQSIGKIQYIKFLLWELLQIIGDIQYIVISILEEFHYLQKCFLLLF